MQNFDNIPSTDTIVNSRQELLNNDLTIMSCSSGTSFPTTNIQQGMLCFRTDLSQLYQLKDLTPTWVSLCTINANGSVSISGNAASLSAALPILLGGTGLTDGAAPPGYGLGTIAQDITGGDLNLVSRPTGFYKGNSISNAPNSGWFYIIQIAHDLSSWIYQQAISFGSGNTANIVYTRCLVGGTWTAWAQTAVTANPTFTGTVTAPTFSGALNGNATTAYYAP